jgi:hypothetical protein
MLKKSITFTDFNGQEQTEEHYFNLTKAEILEMEMTGPNNSFHDHLQSVMKSENGQLIMDAFKSILFKSYGIKSDDGKRFIKSDQITLDFSHSGAYDVLFVELVTDAGKAAEFINGLVPAELAQAAASQAEDVRVAALAAKGGFNQKRSPEKKTVEVVPSLPAAEPVLESYNEHVANTEAPTEGAPKPDFGSMSEAELRAHFAKQ